MNSICGVQWIALNDLKQKSFINTGHVAEQFIAQHLAFMGKNNVSPVLTYWLRKGRAGNAEIDFITQLGQAIVPVEVKAGKSGSLKSLQQFVHQKKSRFGVRFDLNIPSYQHVSHALRQTKKSVQVDFDLLSLPLYMVEELPRIFYRSFPRSSVGMQPGMLQRSVFFMTSNRFRSQPPALYIGDVGRILLDFHSFYQFPNTKRTLPAFGLSDISAVYSNSNR